MSHDAAPDATGRIKQDLALSEIARSRGLDLSTIEYGTTPPFADWEGDQRDLYDVLRNAHRSGLTLGKDTDRIAGLIRSSRWFQAAARKEAERIAVRDAEAEARYRHHEFSDARTANEIEQRPDRGEPLVVKATGAPFVRVGHGASVRSADGAFFIGTIVSASDESVAIDLT